MVTLLLYCALLLLLYCGYCGYYESRWMVRFRVNIKWLVVRFPERRKLSSYQIKGYNEKIRFKEIIFNGYW